jgi:hypothetical protein
VWQGSHVSVVVQRSLQRHEPALFRMGRWHTHEAYIDAFTQSRHTTAHIHAHAACCPDSSQESLSKPLRFAVRTFSASTINLQPVAMSEVRSAAVSVLVVFHTISSLPWQLSPSLDLTFKSNKTRSWLRLLCASACVRPMQGLFAACLQRGLHQAHTAAAVQPSSSPSLRERTGAGAIFGGKVCRAVVQLPVEPAPLDLQNSSAATGMFFCLHVWCRDGCQSDDAQGVTVGGRASPLTTPRLTPAPPPRLPTLLVAACHFVDQCKPRVLPVSGGGWQWVRLEVVVVQWDGSAMLLLRNLSDHLRVAVKAALGDFPLERVHDGNICAAAAEAAAATAAALSAVVPGGERGGAAALADDAQGLPVTPAVHIGVTCDKCHMYPIIGASAFARLTG